MDSRNKYSVYEMIPVQNKWRTSVRTTPFDQPTSSQHRVHERHPLPLSRNDRKSDVDPFFKAGVASFIWLISWGLSAFLFSRGLGSCSTTLSRKSCGVMYSCPSKSTEANLMKRLSLAVSRTAFSCGSCSWARGERRDRRAMSPMISKYTTNQCGSLIDLIDPLDHLSRVVINHNSMDGSLARVGRTLQDYSRSIPLNWFFFWVARHGAVVERLVDEEEVDEEADHVY